MGLPRSKYVREGEEGVYHCYCRCVRRAYLFGAGPETGRDFSHRKVWIVDRLRFLAGIFGVEVCAYAVMTNHYHVVVRTRPDLVAGWTDCEVAARWLSLCPRRDGGRPVPPADGEIEALAGRPERIAQLRKRLGSLSWFMARLNEHIARAANREDGVKGRFWESRFKCQVLLDEAAIAACMVYVDLNPVRAGQAETPEESSFTSIRERMQAWRAELEEASAAPVPADLAASSTEIAGPDGSAAGAAEPDPAGVADETAAVAAAAGAGPRHEIPSAGPHRAAVFAATAGTVPFPPAAPGGRADWLCPVQTGGGRRGILQLSEIGYFRLVDHSGRLVRPDKRGAMAAGLAPLLQRLGVNPATWQDTVSHFGSGFRLAAGPPAGLQHFAGRLGQHWLQGISTARMAFSAPQPDSA